MEVDEIITRIVRIRKAIGFDNRDGELGYTKFLPQTDGSWTLKTDEMELIVKIQAIISEIAAIKDHLIILIKNRGEDGHNSVNGFIKQTFELQLLLDYNNYFKHGPLKKAWTNLQPELVNLSSTAFQFRSVPKGSPTRKITMSFKDGKVSKEGPGIKTVVSGILIDKNKQYICTLEEMIENSVTAIEYFSKVQRIAN